ncbi:MAG TPA: glycosyltransferase family 9 protein [Pirellulales bacterium]
MGAARRLDAFARQEAAPMKIAVFLPTWIGDAAMATPALRAIRKKFGGDSRIVGVGLPYLQELFAGTNYFDDYVASSPKSKQRREQSLGVAWKLRPEQFDAAILMRNSFREAAVAWLAGAKRRIGYVRYLRGPLLTDKLYAPRENGKPVPYRMTDYYLQLAYALGCAEETQHIELATTPADESAADQAWEDLGLRHGEAVVTFNASGAFGATKLWPTEHFAALARKIASELGLDVLVICGPSERERAAQIASQASHPRVFSLGGRPLSLGLSKACIKRSRLLVTTDSGPRQFAVAFDVPLVSIFGPTFKIWGENPTANEIMLQKDLPCISCQRQVCPLKHHACMRDLSVNQVYRAALTQLQRRRKAAA